MSDPVDGSLIGPYRIVRVIGSGGMGTVYEGLDTRLNRRVAIKAAAAAFDDRLRREARAISALNHPHVCTLYDVVEQDGCQYLVMEYVEGRTLADRLKDGALPSADVVRFGAQTADALAAAHAAGILHRDLKPANIMLTEAGVKVLDFGLAKTTGPAAADESTRTITAVGTLAGTLPYMAPERLDGKDSDARSDIFALGLVLYEMATGRRAFSGDSVEAVVTQVIRCEPPPLGAGSAHFRRTVNRCLAKDPANRWHSAADVRLELVQPPEEVSGVPERATAAKRRWGVAPAAIAAIAVLGLVTALFWPAAPASFPSVIPFATDFETQTMPAWSPRGDRIAYAACVRGVYQVFTKSLNASESTQRTEGDQHSVAPKWSADGTRIYFNRGAELWFVPVAGGAAERVHERALKGAFSPDGRSLALLNPGLSFSSPPDAAPASYKPFASRAFGFGWLEYTRDGKHLGISATKEDRVTFSIMPVDGGPPREFETRSIGFADAFTWMPGEQRIVLAGIEGESRRSAAVFRLAMWDLRSASVRYLTDETSLGEFPALSPDGRTLAYVAGRQDYDLLEVPLDGSGAVRSFLGTLRDESSPCWAPDGGHLAYATDRSGQMELRVRSADGGSERVIASQSHFPSGTATIYNCAFSPDGRRIAYGIYQRGAFGIWVSPLTGEPPAPLRANQAASNPTWSPDGQWICYKGVRDRKQAVLKMKSGGGEPEFVAWRDATGLAGPIAWSSKGDWIAFGESRDLIAVSPDGSSRRILSPHPWSVVNWASDGATLYGIYPAGNRMKLARIDSTTARETVISDLGPLPPPSTAMVTHGQPMLEGFAISRDGKTAVTALLRQSKAIYLMRDFDERPRLIDAIFRSRSR